MKYLKSIVIALLCVISAQAQKVQPYQEEQKMVNEIFVSARNGHYYRAERFVKQLRWSVETRKYSNAENYKQAYKLMDSVKYYKNNSIPLDVSNAATVNEDAKLDAEIKGLKDLLKAEKMEQLSAKLGELNIKLAIKEASEKLQEEKAIQKKAVLSAYQKDRATQLKSNVISKDINVDKIDSILTVLRKPETAADVDKFSILQQELQKRQKVNESVQKMRFLSASMDYKTLQAFLADPKPIDNSPKPEFVPTTANQKRIVWLNEQMMADRKAGKYINLWPMTQELNYRNEIEQLIKKGKEKDIPVVEEAIKEIQFR